jgi:hypothetical protein
VLGGDVGIGKDTLIAPLVEGVGSWNFSDIGPAAFIGRFNDWARAVVIRINEAREGKECNPVEFYEHAKSYMAAPPDSLLIDAKNTPEFKIPNVCGIIITTNHKLNGVYFPPDDRRHFFAWSCVPARDPAADARAAALWNWYEKQGGYGHVIAYLRAHDLSHFNPKAPPPRTDAWRAVVTAGIPAEDAELADVLDAMGRPEVVTIPMIAYRADSMGLQSLREAMCDRSRSKIAAARLHTAGYDALPNPHSKSGLWRIGTDRRRTTVYMRHDIPKAQAFAATEAMR